MITLDGVRWQEVFKGADKTIITNNIKEKGTIEEIEEKFWSDDEKLRREKLLPFFWNTIEEQGQLYGNKERGSVMRLTNPYFFSYPGYNELLVGFSDDSINSNEKIFNPNTNVLEYMNQQTGFKGQVAAFASWDVFDWIINKDRNDFNINSGAYPYEDSVLTQKQKWMNSFVSHMPYEGYGLGVRWDALTHEYAFDYLKYRKPRLLYIAYDETDEYAHQLKYDLYLKMIHRSDEYIGRIWKWLQSNDMYRNKTTLIITTDHGRGEAEKDGWGSHGQTVPGAQFVWTAILGPDTPQMGEVTYTDTIATNQIAATIAHLFGYDYKSNRETGEVIQLMVAKK
ncbi:MAG: sulfatase-like hydrolase/transferase [Candidatus Marinimicrobia bacterium]|nr:sulfatase-like hydrolase/transferase [Candidatus Neomarinimicrobiota bacterium]